MKAMERETLSCLLLCISHFNFNNVTMRNQLPLSFPCSLNIYVVHWDAVYYFVTL